MALTRPEAVCDYAIGKAIVEKIIDNPCRVCVNGISGWGKSGCNFIGRSYPMCMDKPGATFVLDVAKLRGDK